MFSKMMNILKIVVAVLALLLIGVYAYLLSVNNYCKDEIPATSSIYVYPSDKGVSSFNNIYINAKNITPESGERYITREDVPEIARLPGVEAVYLYNESLSEEFVIAALSGMITEGNVAVPTEVMRYFSSVSQMDSLFALKPDTIPDKDAEYSVITCGATKCEWNRSVDPKDCIQFFYKYDESSWEDFKEEYADKLIEDGSASKASMLIKLSSGNDESLLNSLISKYPASNYHSAEFVRIFRGEVNKAYWMKILPMAILTIVATAFIEVLITVLQKIRCKRLGLSESPEK